MPLPDFYHLLQVPRDASLDDVKVAYRRTILCLHPDKQSRPRSRAADAITTIIANAHLSADPSRPPLSDLNTTSVDMALLKEAYETLSDARSRAAYDGSLRREEHAARSRGPPRPAEVISLEDFTAIELGTETETETETRGSGARAETEAADSDARHCQEWRHGCRCGGTYRIWEDDLENGTHLVGCDGCSEVVWVGYEEVVTEDEEGEVE